MSIVDQMGSAPTRRHDSEGVRVSSLMGSIIDAVGPESLYLPDIGAGDDLELYQHRVNKSLRAYEVPDDLEERKRRGNLTRLRAIKVLEKLSETGTSTRATTAGQWHRLYRLAKFCARDQDWCSSTGPVIGATGDTLRTYLAVRNLREIFEPLLASGLVVPHRQRANGRRHFYVINPRTNQERVDASGWSLAPLMFLLDELEMLHSHEKELLAERCSLPKAINKALKDARAALRPHLDKEWARTLWERSDDLERRGHNARKGCIEKLRARAEEAHAYRLTVEFTVDKAEFPGASGVIPAVSSGETIPDIYNSNYHAVSSNCSARRRRDALEAPSISDPTTERESEPPEETDEFGIERSGFKIAEAPALFPFSDGLFDLASMRAEHRPYAICRLMGVPQSSVTRSIAQIGLFPTLLCLLITGQHASDAEIRSTPDIYFKGLIKKARARDLNIGHTIFGRRAIANSQRSKPSAINYVGTDICYG